MGAFDIARGDVLMKEGITGLRKAVGMADLLGYELKIHGINQPMLELANLHVALSMTNGKWSVVPPDLLPRAEGHGALDIDAEGYKHLPPGLRLGAEIDWNWIDDIQKIVRTARGVGVIGQQVVTASSCHAIPRRLKKALLLGPANPGLARRLAHRAGQLGCVPRTSPDGSSGRRH